MFYIIVHWEIYWDKWIPFLLFYFDFAVEENIQDFFLVFRKTVLVLRNYTRATPGYRYLKMFHQPVNFFSSLHRWYMKTVENKAVPPSLEEDKVISATSWKFVLNTLVLVNSDISLEMNYFVFCLHISSLCWIEKATG